MKAHSQIDEEDEPMGGSVDNGLENGNHSQNGGSAGTGTNGSVGPIVSFEPGSGSSEGGACCSGRSLVDTRDLKEAIEAERYWEKYLAANDTVVARTFQVRKFRKNQLEPRFFNLDIIFASTLRVCSRTRWCAPSASTRR